MPNYIDKDYNESEELRTNLYNRFLESDFKEIKFYQATSTLLEAQIVIENRENPYVVMYKVYSNLNHYEIIPIGFVKLHKSEEKYYTVCGSYCEEFYRGSHFMTSLYYSLFKNGILLQSDFVHYGGAKPLWKALSRIVPVEIYDRCTREKFDYNSFTSNIKDEEIWGCTKSNLILRIKDL